ncbi:hypothetical protein JCM10212_006762 [Sporobolomyces blumeae]
MEPDDLLERLALPPSTPLSPPSEFFEALAHRLSAIKKGGVPDVDFAGRWLVHAFRDGKLGRWTLDGLGRGGEATDDFRELAVEDMVETEEGAQETVVRMRDRELPRRGYLSGEKRDEVADQVSSTAHARARAPTTPDEPDSTTLTLESLRRPFPRSFNPEPSSPPSRLDDPVHRSISGHVAVLAAQASQLDLQSSHQAKKAEKVQQARAREFKRKSHEVTRLKPTSFRESAAAAGAAGGPGHRSARKGGPMLGKARGPVGKGLSSGRRRQYRR